MHGKINCITTGERLWQRQVSQASVLAVTSKVTSSQRDRQAVQGIVYSTGLGTVRYLL